MTSSNKASSTGTSTSAPTTDKAKPIDRRRALAVLGMTAVAAYLTPALTPLGGAHASGAKASGAKKGGGGLGSFGSGGKGEFIINDTQTASECGECHQAYGAESLPQGSWRRIMGDLPNHFGEDASLDEATRKHIEDYLVANSQPGNGPLRISETRWFISEHRGEVSDRALKKAGSWANCKACHN